MKKFLAFAVAAVALSGTAHAQTASSTAAVTATVVVPLTVTKLTDMAFGNLTRGVAATIPAGPGPATSASWRFLGDEGDNVFFTFAPMYKLYLNGTHGNTDAQVPGIIIAPGQDDELELITDAGIRHLSDPTTAITILSPGTNNPHHLSIDNQDGSEIAPGTGVGQMYLYIGGTITPAANQQRGNYTGTIAVSADYAP